MFAVADTAEERSSENVRVVRPSFSDVHANEVLNHTESSEGGSRQQ